MLGYSVKHSKFMGVTSLCPQALIQAITGPSFDSWKSVILIGNDMEAKVDIKEKSIWN